MTVQCDAIGVQIHQHINGVTGRIGDQTGIDKTSGIGTVIYIPIIAKIVSKGIVPVGTAIFGSGSQRIQTAAIIIVGGIPTDIGRRHNGAVMQCNHGGDSVNAAGCGIAIR